MAVSFKVPNLTIKIEAWKIAFHNLYILPMIQVLSVWTLSILLKQPYLI